MPLRRRALSIALLVTLFRGEASAQIVFNASDIQNHIGQHRSTYVATNLDPSSVSGLIGTSGGPQSWDFSQPPGTNDVIETWAIVAPSDAQNTSGLSPTNFTGFSNATFAERVTESGIASFTWSFYSITNNQGLWYYGLYTQSTNGTNVSQSFAVNEPPEIIIPDPLQLGQGWTTSTDFTNILVGFSNLPLDTHIYTTNYADAYGTVTLPQLGTLPALRYIQWYYATNSYLGGYVSSEVVIYYLWMVRGIGPAAQITAVTNLPGQLGTNYTLSRVFEASPRGVSNLRLKVQNGSSTLTWDPNTNGSGFEIESLPNLASTNWQLRASVTSNSWSIPNLPTQPQLFFRVFLEP